MKATAWPAVPVFTAMLAARDGARNAWRFAAATVVIAIGLAVLMAPAALANPYAFLQNTVLFPLGLTKHKTPAASPLPGHLLADTGMAGHWAAVGLLIAAGVGFAVWLDRPAADRRARRRVAPGPRPHGHVHAGPGDPVGLLRVPDRAGRVAAADPAADGDHGRPPPSRSRPRPVSEQSHARGRALGPSGPDAPGFQVGLLGGGERVDRGARGGQHEPGGFGVDGGGHLVHAGRRACPRG